MIALIGPLASAGGLLRNRPPAAAAVTDDRIAVAHFEIVGKLGEGGMGVVYEAIDRHLDRLIALKILPPEKVDNPARKLRFIQEARTATVRRRGGSRAALTLPARCRPAPAILRVLKSALSDCEEASGSPHIHHSIRQCRRRHEELSHRVCCYLSEFLAGRDDQHFTVFV